MKKFLILGDSHLVALVDAARALAPQRDVAATDNLFSVQEFVLETEQAHLVCVMPLAGAPPLVQNSDGAGLAISGPWTEQLRSALALLGGGAVTVCSCFFGNEHAAFSIADHPVPFDFFRSADDAAIPAEPPRQIVPLAVIERRMADLGWRAELYCRVLKLALPGQRVVHILPPPPIADEAQVRGSPEIFGRLFDEHPVAPALLRLKVFDVYCRVLSERIGGAGVEVVGTPAASLDGPYLAQPYWREATHANGRYGHLILQTLGVL